jgi:class 3 adenylate cyclase
MARLQRKSLERPDEVRKAGGAEFLMFEIGDHEVSWASAPPGWRWRDAVKPIAGTELCEFHHMGFSISGRVHIEHRDGVAMEIGPQQFFEIPPFHDAWVVGDEPWVAIDWGENVAFARAEGMAANRMVATLLFTDIVDSTATARQLGDARWRDLLARHNRLARTQLERYRGREMTTTGDGLLAIFESSERAVHAALGIASGMPSIGLRVRCGVHTGEVELESGNVRGVSVHVAARVMSLAGPGEVLVSWTTRDLLAGSNLSFEDRGTHELKGLSEPRAIYAVTASAR